MREEKSKRLPCSIFQRIYTEVLQGKLRVISLKEALYEIFTFIQKNLGTASSITFLSIYSARFLKFLRVKITGKLTCDVFYIHQLTIFIPLIQIFENLLKHFGSFIKILLIFGTITNSIYNKQRELRMNSNCCTYLKSRKISF